uniref:DUF3825 domain-containing protein n=1 Tax=Strongyloides venezuelensis TaxID=75913 RepID=A0A0K0F062_STRVS
MRQENEESIMQFNTRFYQKMIEVYPEYDRRITEVFSEKEVIFTPTEIRSRTQIFNDYVATVKKDREDKISFIDGTGKCLRYGINKAVGIEANIRDYNERTKEKATSE